MNALKQDGAVNDAELPAEQLQRIYAPIREQITDSVRRQEALLQQIQVAEYPYLH